MKQLRGTYAVFSGNFNVDAVQKIAYSVSFQSICSLHGWAENAERWQIQSEHTNIRSLIKVKAELVKFERDVLSELRDYFD